MLRKLSICFRSHEQNLQQNCSIKIVNKSFENVTQFKYLEMILMNQQRFIQNARFNEGYNFVQFSGAMMHATQHHLLRSQHIIHAQYQHEQAMLLQQVPSASHHLFKNYRPKHPKCFV
jgi:hypothetical protein